MIGLLIYFSIGTAIVIYLAIDGTLEKWFEQVEEELFFKGIVAPYSLIVVVSILCTVLFWPGTIQFNSKKDNE
jgi:uncharacterized membrane protein YdjX (TVP38/TMEM64 family)